MNEAPLSPIPGTKYQFVVNSAEEAVKVIHEKFGGNARVVSVKQLGGSGLGRLLGSPKLEIIAEITPAAATAAAQAARAPAPAEPAIAPAGKSPAFGAANLPQQSDESTLPDALESMLGTAESEPEIPATRWKSASSYDSHSPSMHESNARNDDALERILTAAGITPRLLAQLKAARRWEKIVRRPLRESIYDVVDMLRLKWDEEPERPLGRHIAFFGTPGSGITTALCKALTMDVFFLHLPARVIKLDGDQPNPSEGLAMFCEALNVPLARWADGLAEISEGERVYFDVAGVPLSDAVSWRDLGRLFSEFYVDTRVLVLNAAYDVDLIKRTCELATAVGATHTVFTHLDEVQHWGKLWNCILGSGLTPLFFSQGQNVSGNLSENIFSTLVEKTFRISTTPALEEA